LEGPSGGLQSNLLLRAGSAVRSDQLAQRLVQLGLENLPQWKLHSGFGQPVGNGGLSSWGKYFSFCPVRYSSFYLHMLLVVFLPLCHARDLVSFSMEGRRLQRNLHMLMGGYWEDRAKLLN